MDAINELIHKVRSPITSILGYSELLEKNLKTKDGLDKEAKWAKTINVEIQKIQVLIDEISKKIKS